MCGWNLLFDASVHYRPRTLPLAREPAPECGERHDRQEKGAGMTTGTVRSPLHTLRRSQELAALNTLLLSFRSHLSLLCRSMFLSIECKNRGTTNLATPLYSATCQTCPATIQHRSMDQDTNSPPGCGLLEHHSRSGWASNGYTRLSSSFAVRRISRKTRPSLARLCASAVNTASSPIAIRIT